MGVAGRPVTAAEAVASVAKVTGVTPGEVIAVFNTFLDKMAAMEAQVDYVEASGKVVVQFDPETGRRTIHGPFPKETALAEGWAASTKAVWEKANGSDGPPIEFTVELLFPLRED